MRKYIFAQESFYLRGMLNDINKEDTSFLDCKHKHMMKAELHLTNSCTLWLPILSQRQILGTGNLPQDSALVCINIDISPEMAAQSAQQTKHFVSPHLIGPQFLANQHETNQHKSAALIGLFHATSLVLQSVESYRNYRKQTQRGVQGHLSSLQRRVGYL